MKNEIVTSIDDINILYDNNSLLPQIFNTSSPEIIIDSLVNGRIVILLDNTQVATILPANLSTFTVSKSYVNTPRFFSIFNHILISLFFFLSIFMMGLFIAIINFHPAHILELVRLRQLIHMEYHQKDHLGLSITK